MPRGKRKPTYFGTRSLRQVIVNRTSKEARPWNHKGVVDASITYGIPFGSYKEVARHENMLEGRGDLEAKDRHTCGSCSKLVGFDKNPSDKFLCTCGEANESN